LLAAFFCAGSSLLCPAFRFFTSAVVPSTSPLSEPAPALSALFFLNLALSRLFCSSMPICCCCDLKPEDSTTPRVRGTKKPLCCSQWTLIL
jgi:hypothetical protein